MLSKAVSVNRAVDRLFNLTQQNHPDQYVCLMMNFNRSSLQRSLFLAGAFPKVKRGPF